MLRLKSLINSRCRHRAAGQGSCSLRELNGLLLLDKPAGVTSNGVLQQVRKLFGAKKAGHTGSLDPSATGMLPICFGEGTKLCAYLLNAEKTYEVEGLLGISTDTEDADGEVIAQAEVPPISQSRMAEAVAGFAGDSMQRPPVYSALKVNGVRSHKLARKGAAPELEMRPIHVPEIQLLGFSGNTFSLRLRVSKGTYIRSIVRDIGDGFGCGAHVTSLRRVSVSPFEQHTMHSLQDIQAHSDADTLLLAVDEVISDWPQLNLDADTAMKFRNGSKPLLDQALQGAADQLPASKAANDLIRIYDPTGKFLGLGKISDGRLQTVRIIGGQLQ